MPSWRYTCGKIKGSRRTRETAAICSLRPPTSSYVVSSTRSHAGRARADGRVLFVLVTYAIRQKDGVSGLMMPRCRRPRGPHTSCPPGCRQVQIQQHARSNGRARLTGAVEALSPARHGAARDVDAGHQHHLSRSAGKPFRHSLLCGVGLERREVRRSKRSIVASAGSEPTTRTSAARPRCVETRRTYAILGRPGTLRARARGKLRTAATRDSPRAGRRTIGEDGHYSRAARGCVQDRTPRRPRRRPRRRDLAPRASGQGTLKTSRAKSFANVVLNVLAQVGDGQHFPVQWPSLCPFDSGAGVSRRALDACSRARPCRRRRSAPARPDQRPRRRPAPRAPSGQLDNFAWHEVGKATKSATSGWRAAEDVARRTRLLDHPWLITRIRWKARAPPT